MSRPLFPRAASSHAIADNSSSSSVPSCSMVSLVIVPRKDRTNPYSCRKTNDVRETVRESFLPVPSFVPPPYSGVFVEEGQCGSVSLQRRAVTSLLAPRYPPPLPSTFLPPGFYIFFCLRPFPPPTPPLPLSPSTSKHPKGEKIFAVALDPPRRHRVVAVSEKSRHESLWAVLTDTNEPMD